MKKRIRCYLISGQWFAKLGSHYTPLDIFWKIYVWTPNEGTEL